MTDFFKPMNGGVEEREKHEIFHVVGVQSTLTALIHRDLVDVDGLSENGEHSIAFS
jgi:hypothetical protein